MENPSSRPLSLSVQGRPCFEIVLPAAPSPAEEFAAEELGRTLYAIIGPEARLHCEFRAGMPRLYLNDWDAAKRAGIDGAGIDGVELGLGKEMFHLETRGADLYLLGGGPRGVLYGVYELLEGLGCRWYTPELSHIPRIASLTLPPLCKTGGPAFENRDTFNSECRDPLWRVRNRMNGWSAPVPEYMGGNVDYCGFVHTFDGLLPPAEFFAAHPEYFSLVAGQRRSENAQLCLTNPAVLRIVTERVLERMHAHPRATIFSVSQNDCYGYCECEACRAVAEAEGSQSGPMLRFVNAVAAETAKVYPDKLIDTLAYQYTLDAPRLTVPHPNVRVRLCSISCCQGHVFGTCEHPESLRFLRALQSWAALTSQIYIWHYATDFDHYQLPMPDFDELQGNLSLYKRSGVRGLFVQGMGEPGGGAELMALRGYVVSKLLWQPDQPVWPLVDEFLMACYGAAASGVREYLDIFHGAVRRERGVHPSLFDWPDSPQFDAVQTEPAERALAAAETLVTGERRRRVRLLRGGLRYIRLFRACGAFKRSGERYGGAAAPGDLEEMNALLRFWKKSGIQRIHEGDDFDFTAQLLRGRLQSHTVEWLRDERQQIAVIPSLGGRLTEWQCAGREWLTPPDTAKARTMYPFVGGYAETVVLGMYVSRGWGEAYRAEWQNGKLTLGIRVGEHLRLTRRLWLADGALQLESRLRNAGSVPVSCSWKATLQYALPSAAEIMVQDAQGENPLAWEQLPEGAALNLTGEKAPLNGWQVHTAGGLLFHTVTARALEGFSLTKQAQGPRLLLEWRTAMRDLAPGESIHIRQTIRLA